MKLKLIGDHYLYKDALFPIDGKWHSSDFVWMRIVEQPDGTFLVMYQNQYYLNSPLSDRPGLPSAGRENRNDSSIGMKGGKITLKAGESKEIGLIFPRYEYASGFTNNYCVCDLKIIDE